MCSIKMGGIVRLAILSMSRKSHSHTNLLTRPWNSISSNWYARTVWNELSVSAVVRGSFSLHLKNHATCFLNSNPVSHAEPGYVVGCPYEGILIYVVYMMPFFGKTADLFVLKMGAFFHLNNHHHMSKFHCKPLYPPRVSLCWSRVPGSFQNRLYLIL